MPSDSWVVASSKAAVTVTVTDDAVWSMRMDTVRKYSRPYPAGSPEGLVGYPHLFPNATVSVVRS
jgi:hypothetical protein